jgi:hypothetical protein
MTREKLREKTPLHSTELSYNGIPMGTVLAGFLPIFCRFFADLFRNFPEFSGIFPNLQVYPPILATWLDNFVGRPSQAVWELTGRPWVHGARARPT